MKRFVTGMVIVAALLLTGWYMIFGIGVYIPRETKASLEVPFKSQGKQLLRRTNSQEYEELEMRCVEVSASLPAHFSTEFYPEKKDYLRWFHQIANMGANAVKAAAIMDSDFYNALYEYNKEQDEPLYLLQGLAVADAVNYGVGSGYDEEFMGQLVEDGHKIVDIVHGRKVVLLGTAGGSSRYTRDVSPWVIGFLVGNEWSQDTVAYTEKEEAHRNTYNGDYFSASEKAGHFESMLAQVMDEIVRYETEKYGTQRPVGFFNSPRNDFLEYEENYAIQLKKYSYLDAENILPGKKNQAGTYAAYMLYDFCEDFSGKLSQNQINALGKKLESLDKTSSYEGYIELLGRYHTMPVICASYSFSSARGAVRMGDKPLTEEEQGQKLLEIYQDAVEFGWSGVCISSWQDEWEKKSWNTSFSVNMQRRNLWQNAQTAAQGNGLMAFDPGEERPVCTVDGDSEEWKEDNEVHRLAAGRVLSVQYDWKGLYLLIKGADFHSEETLYLPIDISPDTGSKTSADPKLTFNRNADFILCVNGENETELLVWDRYQAMRQNFGFEISGQNTFYIYPDKESTTFEVVQMALENPMLLEDYVNLDPGVRREKTAYGIWETGKLIHGDGNPGSEKYNSLADFCFGEDCVEIRIPWGLLNISDPSAMTVHKDYYEHYGVETENISRIWIGICENGSAELSPFTIGSTGRRPDTHERLKNSYYILQDTWKEAEHDSVR